MPRQPQPRVILTPPQRAVLVRLAAGDALTLRWLPERSEITWPDGTRLSPRVVGRLVRLGLVSPARMPVGASEAPYGLTDAGRRAVEG